MSKESYNLTRYSHIEWHVEAGLTATLLEAPDHLQKSLTIPADHLEVCHLDRTPTVGNAAGNSQNFLDLAGQPTTAAEYDYGYVSHTHYAFMIEFKLIMERCLDLLSPLHQVKNSE